MDLKMKNWWSDRIGGHDFFGVSNTTDILFETVDPLYRAKLSGNVPRTRAKFDVVFAFFFRIVELSALLASD